MKQELIFHIATTSNWETQLESEEYTHPSLVQEGFIHCCYIHQIDGVLQRYFQTTESLYLLTLNLEQILSPIKLEVSPSVSDSFPHIYGAINKNAILKIEKINSTQ